MFYQRGFIILEMTSEHHAIMFALIVKQITGQEDDTNVKKIIKRGLRKYGNQRGHRMALRAIKNSDDLSFWNYLAYQEWKVPGNEIKKKIIFDTSYLHSRFIKCPWVEYWIKHDVLEYGKLYCPNTDYALFEGFNPEIVIHLPKNRANGDESCDFHFINEKFSFLSAVKMLIKKTKLGNSVIMSWGYHTAHIFYTFRDILIEELGIHKSNLIISGILNEFSNKFGDQVIQSIKQYENENFNII